MPQSRLIRVVEIIQRRRARRIVQSKAFGQRSLQGATLLLGVLSGALAFLALVSVPIYSYVTFNLPAIEELETLLDPETGALLQPTRFYDRTGQQLLLSLEPPGIRRAFIEDLDLTFLAPALIASSDPDVYRHDGYGWTSLSDGPRTLAERLVANLLLGDESPGWLKTLRTRMLAAQATEQYGHAQILTWALNSATFGHWTFGAESAAQLYFGKAATELSLANAALLAAVAQAPALNPIDAPELAIEFQRLVLASMRTQGLIDDESLAQALAEPLIFTSASTQPISQAAEFTDVALAQLEGKIGRERVQRGGLEVITTLDYALHQEIGALITQETQTELVVLNPSNGQMLAIGGPIEDRDMGGLSAPFVYLSAFAQGYSPASLVWDLPQNPSANISADLFHGPVSMRQALANNYSRVAEDLAAQIGSENLAQVLSAAGLEQDAELQINALQAAQAYAMLANLGMRAGQFDGDRLHPAALLFVHDGQRLVLDWSQTQTSAATSAELAYLITNILSDASVRELATLDAIGGARPVALQISQDTQNEASWFAAYSPQRVLVGWQEDDQQPGGSDLWAAVFAAAHRDLPIQNWRVPGGLTSIIVCVPSGLLPDADCAEMRSELFLNGTEPVEYDRLHQHVAINTLNGLRATVFSAQEFVQERLFLQIPVEAESWAQAAGISLPPKDYDPIPDLDLESGAEIINPAPFSMQNGVINISGQVTEDAVSYDIQVGEGLYPTEWLLIAEGAGRADNPLARWDATGLSGLYAIQLQMWDAQGNLTRAYTIVTIGE